VAAAGLFRDLGYHRVAIEEIAGAVGITGRAIYRHYANKHDLLAHVVFSGVDRLEEAAGQPDMTLAIRSLAAASLDHRELGVLVQREARHLDEPEQAELRRRTAAVVTSLGGRLRAERRDLSADDAALLVHAALSVLASPSHHNVALSRERGASLLEGMAARVLASPVSSAQPRRSRGSAEGPASAAGRASRREAVLAAAIELFARRGYAAVRMEDVGAAAGIAGPSIYEHFAGKADLLMAALTRGAEWLQLGISDALSAGRSPAETLESVLRSYVEFMLEHTDLMAVLLSEAIHLPDEERRVLRRVQHEYVSEWVQLLGEVRPDLSAPEARFVTHGLLAVVNDHVPADPKVRRSDLGAVLVQIGAEVLHG
jgi:AcrR family transcriptional regulator